MPDWQQRQIKSPIVLERLDWEADTCLVSLHARCLVVAMLVPSICLCDRQGSLWQCSEHLLTSQ